MSLDLLKEKLDISVVVSTYSKERFHNVIECLNSLNKQTYSPYEIILVLDPDDELIKFYASRISRKVKIVTSEEKGLSNARNAGIKSASGEIIAFIDDDAVADKNWLNNLVQNYSNLNFFGTGGRIQPVWENGRPAWFPEELDWIVGCTYKGLPEHKSCVRNPIGCNMSFRKCAFDKVGYFKSNIGRFGKKLIGSEEAEFSMRLLIKIPGSKIIYDPSAIVYHRVPTWRISLHYSMQRAFYEGVSKKFMKNILYSSSNTLFVEKKYLTYLLNVSIPSRLMRIHKIKNLVQAFILIASASIVLVGYFTHTGTYIIRAKKVPLAKQIGRIHRLFEV